MLIPRSSAICFLNLPDASATRTCFSLGLNRATRGTRFLESKSINKKCRNEKLQAIAFNRNAIVRGVAVCQQQLAKYCQFLRHSFYCCKSINLRYSVSQKA